MATEEDPSCEERFVAAGDAVENEASVAVAFDEPVGSAAIDEDTIVAPLEDKLENRLVTPLPSKVVVETVVEIGGGSI